MTLHTCFRFLSHRTASAWVNTFVSSLVIWCLTLILVLQPELSEQYMAQIHGMNVKIRVSIQVTVRSQDPKPKKHMERSARAIPLYHIVICAYMAQIHGMNVKIRVSIQVTVRSQDPKLKKHMERSTRAIPLYHIVILCLSQPKNVRRLPGPPVYTFLREMAKHLGWGAPKHTALMTCLYMLVSRQIIWFTPPSDCWGGHDDDDFAGKTWAGLCVKASVCKSFCV